MNINPIFLSGGIALLLAVLLVLGLALLSLLSGAFHFLFGRPTLTLLKTKKGENGLAFAFSWDSADEKASFDTVSVKLFNPFGTPPYRELTRSFEAAGEDFAKDVDMGPTFHELLSAHGFDRARVSIQVSSGRDGVTHSFDMKGRDFKRKRQEAKAAPEEYNRGVSSSRGVLYQQVSREFIAEPMGETAEKVLKIPTNPRFAPDFLGIKAGGEAKEEAQDNFSVKKVWIDPGCIVCDACEGIYPEVFEVQDETCVIREGAPLDNGLLIEEAAEACPVEVIKFEKA